MNAGASNEVDIHIVVACLQHQQETVRETLPTLMSAAVYADKLTVVTFEADTLIELADFHPIYEAFDDFFDYIGADSYQNEAHADWDEDSEDDGFEDRMLDQLWVNQAKSRVASETDLEKRALLESRIREKEAMLAASEHMRRAAEIER